MDIMLNRILSLIPKKENGDFKHGALTQFAESIGLKSGNVISDWMGGRSHSYRRKLHEISSVYNVSIEWLKGETDDPSPVEPTKSAELGGDMAEVLNMLQTLTPTEIQLVKERINKIIESR